MVNYHPYNPYHTAYASDASWDAQRTQYIGDVMDIIESVSAYRNGYDSSDATSTVPDPFNAHYPPQTMQPPLISVTEPDAQLPTSIDPSNLTFQPDPPLTFDIRDLEAMPAFEQLFTIDYPVPDESYAPMAVLDTAPVQAPAPVPVPARLPSRQPSPKSSIRPRRTHQLSKVTTAAAAASGGLRHKNNSPACLACKKGKIKCRPSASSGRCINCETHNKECILVDPRSKSNPPTVGSLEREIRAMYGKIQGLMFALHGGTTTFFGSLNLPELDPKPCDCPQDQTDQTDRPQDQIHRPGCRVADPTMLCMRAGLMELRSLDDENDESEGEDAEMGTGGSESDDRHSGSNMSVISPIASSGTPMGVFQELSMQLGSPGSEHAPNGSSTSSIGLAGADYFTPGPAARPEIRRIMIEQGKIPSFLIQKTISPVECLELFSLFMKHWNVSVSVLDPGLHTAKYVLAHCPFLFTV
ncbi:hypothetical protein FS749_014841, partial [Ceratobasidium sp. UAMH 11750]